MGSAVGVAVIVGVGVAVQVAVVGRASRLTHPLAISLALQISGVSVGLVWAFARRSWPEVWSVSVQWWWLPLGALGWVIVAALGFAAARLGASATLAIVVATQLSAALALDLASGRMSLTPRHPMGVALLVAGVILVTTRS